MVRKKNEAQSRFDDFAHATVMIGKLMPVLCRAYVCVSVVPVGAKGLILYA